MVGLVSGDEISMMLRRFEFGLTIAELSLVGRRKSAN
jgi:hypothetical protein